MALTLQNIGDAKDDPVFISRVRAALCKAVPAVINEATNTANHLARVAHMAKVLQEPALWTNRYVSYVAGESGVASATSLSAVSDTQITTAVNGLIDMFALNT